MKKFIITYKGAQTDMSQLSKEQIDGIMGKWKTWMEKVGENLADIGAPMGESASVVDDGSDGTAAPLTGYSVISAEDIVSAKEMVKDHPFLSEGNGNYAVDVYELMPLPI